MGVIDDDGFESVNFTWEELLGYLEKEAALIARSNADRSMRQNAGNAEGAGLITKVIRTYDDVGLHGGKDRCEWCESREGEWTYEEALQKGVFERHPGCECEIEISTTKGDRRQSDWTHNEWEDVGENNTEKRKDYGIDKDLEAIYNDFPGKKTIGELREIYAEDVADGWISAISGFDNYLKLYAEIENEVIGQTTVNGIEIKSQSRHFMQRVIGTGQDPIIFAEEHRIIKRSGVEIKDIKDALFNGVPSPVIEGESGRSQVLIGEKCIVSINPDTGNLIQCNKR